MAEEQAGKDVDQLSSANAQQLDLFPLEEPPPAPLSPWPVAAAVVAAFVLLWSGTPQVWRPGLVVVGAVALGVALNIRRGGDPVRWLLGGFILLWGFGLVALGWQRYDRFLTQAFDLSFYDQGLWLLSRGNSPFLTVRGLNLFGHHMNAVLVLLVPFYWLGAGPKFLLVVQVAAQASGAIAIFLLARDRLGDRWLALGMAGVLLLHPTYQFLAFEWFHPDALAVAPLLFAYWAASARRWRWFAVAAVLAVACKEDVALPMAVIGLLIAVRGDRRIGLLTAGASAAWFGLSTHVLIPAINGGGRIYDAAFPEFGHGQVEVVRNALTRPSKTFDVATRPENLRYYRMMLAPVAFLPLAAIPTLLIAAPMLAVNVLSASRYQHEIRYHYASLVLAGVILATVEAVAFLGKRMAYKRAMVGLLLASSLATTVAWGVWPLNGAPYVTWMADSRRAAKQAAVELVPPDASVSASFNLVPQLAHRTSVYQFPLPWHDQAVTHWGVKGEDLHDPAGVGWLAIDRPQPSDDGDPRAQALLDRLLSGEFAIRFDQDDVVVAERVLPPPSPASPPG